MTDIILKAEHLKKVFISGKKSMTAVDDVSFGLERGECLGIVGESGSGKSTIARMLTHLEPVTDGQIFLKGKDITHARGKTLRDIYQDIQMVFQMPMESFDPRCTLGDGIGESLRNMGISRRETRERVENLLEKTDGFLRDTGMHPDLTDAAALAEKLAEAMDAGLAGEKGGLAMIPGFVAAPEKLPEDESVIVIDAGGTHLRTALCGFSGGSNRLHRHARAHKRAGGLGS